MLRNLAAAALLVLAPVLPLCPLAHADRPPITITSATADATLTTLTVKGLNFSSEGNVVKIGEYPPLTVISTDSTTLVALLPPGIAPGSYVLTIAPLGAGEGIFDFWVTIGQK